ncbi:MAG: ATP cone domain-containing protein [Candidatus Bathyarchaeia archaeon]
MKKRSGTMQEFDRAKLEASLKKAGARDEHAAKVAEKVTGRVREATTTSEIKQLAATELRRIDAPVAQKYESFIKPPTQPTRPTR